MCQQLVQINQAQRKEQGLKSIKDLANLKKMIEKLKQDDDRAILIMQATQTIVNAPLRRQCLKSRMLQQMSSEQELSILLQQHKEEFGQYVSKRRLNSKRDMRTLFQTGPSVVCKFGDMIADASAEGIHLFEKANTSRLCKDAIKSGLCEEDDIPGFFAKKILLLPPRLQSHAILSMNRLETHLSMTALPGEWNCIYASQGPSARRLVGKQLATTIIKRNYEHLSEKVSTPENYSYNCMLARAIDLVHPTHQLQAAVLAFPHNAGTVLKRRLVALGYDTSTGTSTANEDVGGGSGAADYLFAKYVLKQLVECLLRQQRFYFEFQVPEKASWRVGLQNANFVAESEHARYPGDDEYSFAFGSEGNIYYKSRVAPYLIQRIPAVLGSKTYGILLDLFNGYITLCTDGKEHPIAFGRGATAFTPAEQEIQRQMLTGSAMVPVFALQLSLDANDLEARPFIKVNFGKGIFINHALLCQPFDAGLAQETPLKGGPDSSILDCISQDKQNQDEEEKLQISAEKNLILRSNMQDGLRSFSQFPPSIYRRSLAATRIQRVWRRYRGRIERQILRERQYEAATTIQRMAKRKLRQLRLLKNAAALLIQRNWRKTCFIWKAIMRTIYQKPLLELHRAATFIQRKWRHWSMYRNSPIATKYHAKIEVLVHAVNTIMNWWRPLRERLREKNQVGERNEAAVTIQRVYRGYNLRRRLRPDLCERLTKIGRYVAKHRKELIRVRAAYILQNAWRSRRQRKVRSDKIKTRNTAAAHLQAFWKGYWVRSHIHLRFSYGESVFLTAVCKNLRSCSFILKMYRPCGIVCPKTR